MKEYILPILIFLGFGALSGILLLIASKVLAVKTDETEAKITEALPGANCGGHSCSYYAQFCPDPDGGSDHSHQKRPSGVYGEKYPHRTGGGD